MILFLTFENKRENMFHKIIVIEKWACQSKSHWVGMNLPMFSAWCKCCPFSEMSPGSLNICFISTFEPIGQIGNTISGFWALEVLSLCAKSKYTKQITCNLYPILATKYTKKSKLPQIKSHF